MSKTAVEFRRRRITHGMRVHPANVTCVGAGRLSPVVVAIERERESSIRMVVE